MEIRKSKETLILTQIEKIILSKAQEILDEIYKESEEDGDTENFAYEAEENIRYLLADAEVEEGEPKGEINISIIM